MKANLNGYYDEIESTASKKDELLELLKDYSVSAHTNEEDEFDYLENDDVTLVVKNPLGGEDLQIELGAEFSLFFELWHLHYSAYKADYERMKKDILTIVGGNSGAMTFFADGKWVGSTLCPEIPAEDAKGTDLVEKYWAWEDDSPASKSKEKLLTLGGEIRFTCWNPANDRTFPVSPKN